MAETVKSWIYTKDESHAVWAPADLADQLSKIDKEGWVSLALLSDGEYICLRAKRILYFRRVMTTEENQRREREVK